MKNILILFLFFLSLNSICQVNSEKFSDPPKIKIEWVKNLKGDFSFTKNWEFPIGVETKADGKAGCADGGFCPQRCYAMLDTNGIVLKDSAKIFYQLLDTTHIPYSIESEAWCYEYAGTNTIQVTKNKSGIISAFTDCNIATHSSLQIEITKNYCTPSIKLVSIMQNGDEIFYSQSGSIRIDKNEFKKNILKAEFNFEFKNTLEPDKKMYWKGKILAPIQN